MAAKLFGDVVVRLGQPAVSGALVAGLVLSPSLLNLIGHLQNGVAAQSADQGQIATIATLGVVLLLFLAGLETDLDELVRAGRGAGLVATGGVAVSLGLITLAAIAGGLTPREAFFVAVMLASTSVSISVQALIELRYLQSREGLTILGAAVTDDVMGLVVFSVTLAVLGVSGVSPVWLVAALAAYLVVSLGLGLRFARPVLRLTRYLRVADALLVLSIAFCLVMAWLAQTAGIAAISGAYLAGLIVGRGSEEVAERIRTVAYALPVPVFLVNVGMQTDLRHLGGSWQLIILVTLASLVAKVVGCGAGALIEGFRGRRIALVGVGMMPRGEVTLVIASLGLQAHVLSPTGYALGVMAVLVSALVTPSSLKLLTHGWGGSTGDELALDAAR